MSIADQITRLNNAKAAIKASLINKGVTVSDKALLDEYPALIDSIEVGSGGEGGGDPFYEELFNQRTNNGTSFHYLFYNCQSSTIDISKLDTSNVTNISYMFSACSNLTSLDVSNLNTNNITEMYYVFSTCPSLTEIIGLDKWNTSNVTAMDSVFYNCNVSSLDLSNWDVSNVTTLGSMFSECRNLAYLNLDGWDTSNVNNMSYMFSYMQTPYLTSLDLSHFNTKKVTNMYGMFNWCNMLQELDIRNFELVHEDGTMAEISSMLEGCDSLHTLRLDNCSNATISKIINESGMPQEPIYDHNTGEPTTRKIYCKEAEATGLSAPNGWEFVFVAEEEPEVPVDPPAGDIPLYVPDEFQGNTEITEVRTMVNESHDSLENMFFACSNLTSVNTEDWNVSNVTNMNSIFNECNKLTSLDLNNWNTSNVTNMFNMFGECKALQSLDLSNWNTSNVTVMSRMFYECNNLTSLNLSNWDMTIIEDTNNYASFMFAYCNSLQELRLDNCSNDTINKIITSYAFPTNTIDGVTRTIYCKEENAQGLVAPTNWQFSFI